MLMSMLGTIYLSIYKRLDFSFVHRIEVEIEIKITVKLHSWMFVLRIEAAAPKIQNSRRVDMFNTKLVTGNAIRNLLYVQTIRSQ